MFELSGVQVIGGSSYPKVLYCFFFKFGLSSYRLKDAFKSVKFNKSLKQRQIVINRENLLAQHLSLMAKTTVSKTTKTDRISIIKEPALTPYDVLVKPWLTVAIHCNATVNPRAYRQNVVADITIN